MVHDDIEDIPSIVPRREAPLQPGMVAERSGNTGKGRQNKRSGNGGGAGIWTRIFLLIALLGAGAACGFAWQLQQQLLQAGDQLERYEQRISDLEDRLSDTDEGMSQNAAVQAAKIKELDSEVRKLWDNVWKKSKARLDKLEASSDSHGKKLAAAENSLAASQSQLKSASSDIARLKSVAGDLDRLMASARTNQAEVERVADTLNRINLDINKLNNRVQANEESVRSIDAFRRQVMSGLTDLQAEVRVLKAAP